MTQLDGRVALVSGAARGIGAATALELAARGARVAVVDLTPERCADTVRRIEDAGGAAVGVGADVSDERAVELALRQITDELAVVDILISNAGITRDGNLVDLTLDDWDAIMAVHLRGAFLLSRACAPAMIAAGRGKMVFVSSRVARGKPGVANYATAKAGLQGLTRALAYELGPSGINVNAVAPGFIQTDMSREFAARTGKSYAQFSEEWAATLAIRRPGVPQDVASAIAYLVSDEASFVTGQVLYIAGVPD
jgi:3-oxoacyl-[acyl-carrier protein] reductase